MQSKHVAAFHRLASGWSSNAKKRTRGKFFRGGADGVAPGLCKTRRERRTTPGTQVVRGFFWLAARWRNHDILSVCTARDRRRAADTSEISRELVDTSHVGELELSAGAETLCMNTGRNSALGQHVVANAAARGDEPSRSDVARVIAVTAGGEERRYAYPKQGYFPEPTSLEHDARILAFGAARKCQTQSLDAARGTRSNTEVRR
jgi:hypothetical protein